MRGIASALQSHDPSAKGSLGLKPSLVREGDRQTKAGNRPLQSPLCGPHLC